MKLVQFTVTFRATVPDNTPLESLSLSFDDIAVDADGVQVDKATAHETLSVEEIE